MKHLIRLELVLIRRSQAVLLALAILGLLLLAAVVNGKQSYELRSSAFESASAQIYQEWRTQPPRNPHEVAHRGMLAYRGVAPLGALEPGVLGEQGATIFLEAHTRNDPYLSPASVRLSSQGPNTEYFFPLLNLGAGLVALMIGFLVGSRNARLGTEPLVSHLRPVPWYSFAQSLTVLLVVVLAVLPGVALAFTTVDSGEGVARLAALLLASVAHLYVLSALGVATGSLVGSKAGGLAAITLVWVLVSLAVPRFAAMSAETLIPVTQLAFDERLSSDLDGLLDAHGGGPENESFRTRVLEEYGVSSVEELPVNFDALLMQEDERVRSPVFQSNYSQLDRQQRSQGRLSRIAWFFSPTPVVMAISAQLSGSNIEAQRAFSESAETYRNQMVERLNGHMALNSKSGDWNWQASDDFFQTFEPFVPKGSNLNGDTRRAVAPTLALFLWLVAAIGLLAKTSRRSA